ncbi:E3 ubiquitin-protein ligase TRIM47-like [Xyrichtys novacula]|uniref:E3 ubiquitin-protein ligase TRIM47-like n=1 Tax=Xyrichtys novacula TaxID=13765 RepID=A0AAV1F9Z5_XYRNO|nr:E3 ubiquitin-protein ligase TRIM47-like [Xyrichtys novacula]
MAESHELFDCSVCLQLLQDPVTTSCGHSYCMICINAFWDRNNSGGYSCPQCRQTFKERPALKRNTLLAALLEEHRRKASQSAAAEDGDTDAEPGDVQCDACTGKKRKAAMFCLVCLASYCETHLKPHFEVTPLKKHKLIQASVGIKDNICSRHDKLLEIYCRSDQQVICLQCVMDGHKGHDTVTVAAEKCESERKLDLTKQEITNRVQLSERKMRELRQAADSIRDSAWEVCDEFEQICAENIRSYVCYIEKKCSEMREKAGEAEKAGVDRTNSHLRELQREVLKLRRMEDKLDQLSQTQNPIQFLQGFQALGDLPVSAAQQKSLGMLADFVKRQKDKMKNMHNNMKKDLFSHSEKNELSNRQQKSETTTTRSFLLAKYKNFKVEVDPNTVAACLCLSDTNSEISWGCQDQAHPDHPDRFTFYHQALCKTGLTRSHYWEVEWDGGVVDLAVSYKGIQRKGSGKECSFGHNNLSWKLTCTSSGCTFWHNSLHKSRIQPVISRKVGIHLDYEAGTLSYYSISDGNFFTLLHQVQTTFTEPLYPGFCVDLGSTLKICNI